LQLNHTGPYSSFILKEYPKFLIENSNNVTNLAKLKMQECNHYTADLAERRRLHEENKAFLKQIHDARQNGTICNILSSIKFLVIIKLHYDIVK